MDRSDTLEGYLDIKEENERLRKKLALALKAKSKYKRMYEKLRPQRKSKRLEKTNRARDLLYHREKHGKPTLREIESQTGVKYGTLKHLAWELRQCKT